MDVRVEIIREAGPELVDAFSRLLPQFSSTAEPLDHEAIDRMVRCDANTVLVARSSEAIIGTLTLVLLPLPSGLRGRVEDVVVDTTARGQGVAALLTQEALRIAQEAGPGRWTSPLGRIGPRRTGCTSVSALRPGSRGSIASRSPSRTRGIVSPTDRGPAGCRRYDTYASQLAPCGMPPHTIRR